MVSPSRVPIGDAQIEVRHPGYGTISRMVTVSAGELSRETMVLVPPVVQSQTGALPAAAPSPNPPVHAAEAPNPAGPVPPAPLPGSFNRPTSVDGSSTSGSGGSWQRTLAWTTGGAALLALGTGVAFQLGSSGRFSKFDGGCVLVPGSNMPVPDPARPGKTQTECASLYDSWKSGNRWALIGYISGGALAVTSAILFATSRSESPSSVARAHVTCRPVPAALVCGGAF